MNEDTKTIAKRHLPVYRRSLYNEFILWTAMPHQEKVKLGLEWQKDFSAYHKIDESTLWRWKHRDDFEKRVDDILKKWSTDKTPDVVHAIYRSAIKGNPLSQQLWLGYFKGYNPRKADGTEENKVEVGVNDIRFIISGFPEPMKSKWNAILTEFTIEANALRDARETDGDLWNERPTQDVYEQTDNDAQNIPNTGRRNEVACRYRERVCDNLERKVSEGDYKSTSWWR